MEPFTKTLNEVASEDIAIVGGKGANLGEMRKAGFPVPPGFCITTEAYKYVIKINNIDVLIKEVPQSIDLSDYKTINGLAGEIARRIMDAHIPDEVSSSILAAYQSAIESGKLVSVRSSATAEDLPEASFAGQQDSFLNVDPNDLVSYVKKCWASLWTERAVHYRSNNRFEHQKVYLSVVIQEMVPSEVSGVAFSMNPLNHDGNQIMIDSAWGLGEGIVSGQVTPDSFVVDKKTGEILQKEISDKSSMVSAAETGIGTVLTTTPENLKQAVSLTELQVKELAEWVRKVERYYRSPQDIEWAFAGNRFYLLQSRPITTLHTQLPVQEETEPEFFNFDPKVEWTNAGGLKERYYEPISVLGWSVIEPCQSEGLRWSVNSITGKKLSGDTRLFANVYGYLFMNFSVLKENMPIPSLSPYLAEDRKGQFIPKRSKLKEFSLSLTALRAGRKMTKHLDKAFYDMLPDYECEIKSIKNQSIILFSDQQLLEFIDRAMNLAKSFFKYQAASMGVAENLYKILAKCMVKWLKDETLSITSKLVSGFAGNLTVKTNYDVWKLAQELKQSPKLCQMLREGSVEQFLSGLEKSDEGKHFLGKLGVLLDMYGHQCSNMDIASDFWNENPRIVLSMVKGFLSASDHTNPEIREEEKRKEREQTERWVYSKLSTHQRFLLKKILPKTQTYMLLRDNRHFYVTLPLEQIKRAIHELASRWEQNGFLAAGDDIFWITLQEMRQIIQAELTNEQVQELIAKRKAAKKVHVDQLPSLFTGVPEIKEMESNAMDGFTLKGIAGSPGTVTGPVKIIRSTDDFARLKEGDILVATNTNPAWTPLFVIAKALVTDYGGSLSHGAIVAREYGIPAVLGTKNATEVLTDGHIITVDGNKGIILISPHV